MCPAKLNNRCPDNQYEIELWIEQRKYQYTRTFNWTQTIPSSDAINWHCKYRVVTNELILGGLDGVEKIVLDVTLNGFDEYVYVILQKKDEFIDIKAG